MTDDAECDGPGIPILMCTGCGKRMIAEGLCTSQTRTADGSLETVEYIPYRCVNRLSKAGKSLSRQQRAIAQNSECEKIIRYNLTVKTGEEVSMARWSEKDYREKLLLAIQKNGSGLGRTAMLQKVFHNKINAGELTLLLDAMERDGHLVQESRKTADGRHVPVWRLPGKVEGRVVEPENPVKAALEALEFSCAKGIATAGDSIEPTGILQMPVPIAEPDPPIAPPIVEPDRVPGDIWPKIFHVCSATCEHQTRQSNWQETQPVETMARKAVRLAEHPDIQALYANPELQEAVCILLRINGCKVDGGEQA